MSNILDKPLESAFGFISVLPGAFSAYRYSALQNDCNGNGPLQMYFKGEAMHKGTLDASIWQKNMYLAEDRILCFELVTKKGSKWTLQYVKSAHAETDVPGTVVELVKQRRRWLNGSFFAAIFALTHTKDIWRSNHSLARKMVFLVEFFYQTISLLFSWFALVGSGFSVGGGAVRLTCCGKKKGELLLGVSDSGGKSGRAGDALPSRRYPRRLLRVVILRDSVHVLHPGTGEQTGGFQEGLFRDDVHLVGDHEVSIPEGFGDESRRC